MTDFPFATVGFDLDGTLVDSAGDLAAATNHALGVAGLAPLPVEILRPMIGGGAKLLLQRALEHGGAPDDADRLLPDMLDYYDAHMADLTRPFPDVVAALDALTARGVTLAVVTNKIERFSIKLLRALGLLDRFACVIGGDTIPGKTKPDPAMLLAMVDRCGGPAAFVGDSSYDVMAAYAAGVPVATFGPVVGADAVFRHFGDLLPTLERLADTKAMR